MTGWPQPSRDPLFWAESLRRAAVPALVGTPLDPNRNEVLDPTQMVEFVRGFADERGARRAVDTPLLSWLLGIDPPASDDGEDQPDRPVTGDVRLWQALGDERIEPMALVAGGYGPLLPAERGIAIEAWTEAELAALHALSHHAAVESAALDGERWARCRSAADYHIAELQPDNATNHPWAAGVFLWLWCIDGAHEARMHGETLLHNCLAGSGVPDRFSACVLLDAARWLDARSNS